MLAKIFKNLMFLTLPAILLTILTFELLARITWDKRLGEPNFNIQHEKRGFSIRPNYSGYYAGQPAKINNLGFRDDEDYKVEKGPNVFRILVLGDSVTYGYGVKFKETWPFLFKQKLEEWKPETDWQVWNMGVPSYEMDAELRTLQDIGPTYKPDLTIIGFYENDLYAPKFIYQTAWRTNLKNFFRKNFYLFFYVRKAFSVLNSRYINGFDGLSKTFRKMTPGELRTRGYLYIPSIDPPEYDFSKFTPKHGLENSPQPPKTTRIFKPKISPTSIDAPIAKFQKYHNEGTYNILFFINIAPDHDKKWVNKDFIGPIRPFYYDGPQNEMNNWLIEIMGRGTPVLSSYDAFWSYRPSEVPGAWHHSLGAANMVKADILFNYVSNKIIKEASE